MRQQICLEILKNFGRLLSFDFWQQAAVNPDFPAWFFVKLIIVGATVDILLMIFDRN
jgi:hypothetical protein